MTDILHHQPGMHYIGESVVALGVFDGVHLGHQQLIADANVVAHQRGIRSVVLTFDRDPDQVVSPGRAAPQLTTLEDKISFISGMEPDAVLVVPFDAVLASMTPDEFAERVLLDAADPVTCIVGYDFRFGARASGDAQTLQQIGKRCGFEVITHSLVKSGGQPITSTRIRTLVSEGKVREAAELLGRPHRLHGVVAHGRGKGRSIGVPTANMDVDSRFALPAGGVYAGWAVVEGTRHLAAISTGVPPMFPEATCVLEAHLLDFDGDLYGRAIVLEFAERLRVQHAFAGDDQLREAIEADIARVRELLGTRQDS